MDTLFLVAYARAASPHLVQVVLRACKACDEGDSRTNPKTEHSCRMQQGWDMIVASFPGFAWYVVPSDVVTIAKDLAGERGISSQSTQDYFDQKKPFHRLFSDKRWQEQVCTKIACDIRDVGNLPAAVDTYWSKLYRPK